MVRDMREFGARALAAGLFATLLILGAACATSKDAEGDLGTSGASADKHAPGIYTPVSAGDLEGIAERGRLLYDMERSLILGYERGLFKVGDPGTDTVLPLVDVDAGGRSGQVVFVRWMHEDIPDASNLDPAKAQRWLLVSLVLWPDNVLDVEQLTGYVAERSNEFYRIAGLLVAARKASELVPDQMFHMHALLEEARSKDKRPGRGRKKLQLVVYLLSAERGGVDLEMTLEIPKKGPPVILAVKTPHEAGDVGDKMVHTRLQEPGPLTVMRVLQQGHTSGEVLVETEGGTTWNVSTEDGSLRRQ
jgi:hypothetical protein